MTSIVYTSRNSALRTRELDRLDKYEEHSPEDTFKAEDGWPETSVRIKLPAEDNRPHPRGDTVKAGLRDASSRLFHHTPFRLYWKPNENAAPERVYGEAYNSDDLLEEYERIQALPRESLA